MANYLTTGEIAEHLHVTVNTVKRWIGDGKIRAFLTPGGHFRIEEGEFKEFMVRYGPSSGPQKVLVVDDDPGQIAILTDTLSGEGYIVDSSADGYEALIKLGEFNPDLLIIDLMMPRLDGVEVIKRLRNNPATKGIKIIVVTSYPERLARVKPLIQGFFIKPLEIDHLKEKVRELLGGG